MTTENQKTLIELARKHEEQMELARKEEAFGRHHLDADHYVPTLPFGETAKTTQAAIEQERMRVKKEELSKAQDANRFINPPGYGAQVVAFCIPDGHPYAPLAKVLEMAFKQSSEGKGKVRHASGGTPFVQQPIMTIGRMVGPGYQAGQAQKKLQEAMGMIERGEFDAAFAEALGTIVYAAAFAIRISELKGAKE